MASSQVNVLLTDTCSVYKLYFFASEKLIPHSPIAVPSLGNVEFHSIVLEEFNSDIEAFHLFKNLKPSPKIKGYPGFLDDVGESSFQKIEDFIKANLTSLGQSKISDPLFLTQKKIYDDYRNFLQGEWRKKNIFQDSKKSKSIPTDEDYLLLYDAILNNVELVTNDEILLEVSRHFLSINSKNSYMAEHIIRAIYLQNNALKIKILECITTMKYMNESFQQSIVFN